MKIHRFMYLIFLFFFLLSQQPCYAKELTGFQKTMQELEKALFLLEMALEEPSINKNKLSKISIKIKALKKDLNTIVEEDEKKVESEFAKLIDLFVKTMKNKGKIDSSSGFSDKDYETLYRDLYENIKKKKGSAFTKKYTRDVRDLMENHRIILKDRIRFLIALNRVWAAN